MAGTSMNGLTQKVTLGSTMILGIGTWKYTPGASDELDDSEFGDTTEKILFGIRKRGTISFEGVAKKGDITGQEELKRAYINKVQITNLRLYEDATSYLEPCQTTGYHSPSSTTGNATQLSYVNISAYDISSEKKTLGKITFTAVVSGDMVEV